MMLWRLMIIYLISLCEWLAEQGQRLMVKSQRLFRATKDKKLWRALINTLKGRSTFKQKIKERLIVL